LYNKNFIKEITCYISDSPIEINRGYRYGVSPIEAIKKGEEKILFLTHPNHWFYNLEAQLKKLIKTLLIKPINKKEKFKRL